jgi:deoxyribonuclease-4
MIKFGPAGCEDAYTGKTADIPVYLADLGLSAFEVQCGRGVQMSAESAEKLRLNAQASGISLSVHAPYYISLTNAGRLVENINYLRQSAALAGRLGAERVVVHTGSVMGQERAEALRIAGVTLKSAFEAAYHEGWHDVLICLETMGKLNQLGTAEEVVMLCAGNDRLIPCIDFGHLYARSLGGLTEFDTVLDLMESELGIERARGCHIHFSKIAFTKSGESKHLTLDDEGGPEWKPLAALLKRRGYRSTVICESRGTQAHDAAAMMRVYKEMGK